MMEGASTPTSGNEELGAHSSGGVQDETSASQPPAPSFPSQSSMPWYVTDIDAIHPYPLSGPELPGLFETFSRCYPPRWASGGLPKISFIKDRRGSSTESTEESDNKTVNNHNSQMVS